LTLPGIHHLDLSAKAISIVLGVQRRAIKESSIIRTSAGKDIAIVVLEPGLMLST
jgi:hypothetical protein